MEKFSSQLLTVLNDWYIQTTSSHEPNEDRQLPWVKDFDVEEAVDRAKHVFWKKGYEATSIADLIKGMGINKGSLYNAFGSKKELFVRAVLKYDRENRKAALAQLEAMDDPVLAIQSLFDTLVAESEQDTERKGCFLVNTALELPHHPEDIQRLVIEALLDFEQFFKRLIRLAQERRDVPETLDAGQVAKSLLSQVVGLRVLARGVFGSEGLQAIRSQAMKQLAA